MQFLKELMFTFCIVSCISEQNFIISMKKIGRQKKFLTVLAASATVLNGSMLSWIETYSLD